MRLGAHNLDRIGSDDDHTMDYDISEFLTPPEYRGSSNYNDIALVRIAQKVPLTPYVRPACLPTERDVQTAKAMATGWGKTKSQDASSSSKTLQKVVLEMFKHSECAESFRYNLNRRLRNGIVDETQICAGSHTEEKDTCHVRLIQSISEYIVFIFRKFLG